MDTPVRSHWQPVVQDHKSYVVAEGTATKSGLVRLAVLKYVTDNPMCTCRDICEALVRSHTQILKILAHFEELGLITHELRKRKAELGGRTFQKHFSITGPTEPKT